MKKNIVKDKSFEFALLVIKHCKDLVEKKELVMSKQLLRSGTAIGALIREAEQAESRKDFVHKMAISLKEANETEYWVDLLFHSDYIEESDYKDLSDGIKELNRLLISIIKTTKLNGK